MDFEISKFRNSNAERKVSHEDFKEAFNYAVYRFINKDRMGWPVDKLGLLCPHEAWYFMLDDLIYELKQNMTENPPTEFYGDFAYELFGDDPVHLNKIGFVSENEDLDEVKGFSTDDWKMFLEMDVSRRYKNKENRFTQIKNSGCNAEELNKEFDQILSKIWEMSNSFVGKSFRARAVYNYASSFAYSFPEYIGENGWEDLEPDDM